jgi:TetR/AcrR family fatty acid metabolism transcriptional regulator
MPRHTSPVRRAQIKKAVLNIISEEGLHSLSSRNLAKRVGITDGGIYRHFKSKPDIIKSIMIDVQDDLMPDLRRIANGESTADDRLFQFLHRHITYLVTHRGIAVLLFSEAAHLNERQLRNLLRSILSEQKSLISHILRDGVREGAWKKNVNIDDASTLYMGILIIFNVRLFLSDKNLRVEPYCRRMSHLMGGLLS